MNYGKLSSLPLGAIQAEGFLKEQLLRNKNGLGGHLDEIEPGMIANPYVHKTHVKQWGNGMQSGWGAEISGNYWTGLVMLAFTLNDPELIAKAEKWVNTVLQKQRPDGYLGTYYEENANIYEDYNAWGNSCGMRALLFYAEATGRQDVFDAVYRCMLWFCDHWAGDRKTGYAGVYITVPMMYCYHKTGDRRLLNFCLDYQDYLCRHDYNRTSYRSLLKPKLVYNSQHAAGYGNMCYMPALVYTGCGDEKFLKATENGIQKVRAKAMHANGGQAGFSEYLAPVSAVTQTEYCGFTTFLSAYSVMSAVTGEARYGDYMEQIIYNGAQGARKKDERAIAYLSAPNQIFATQKSAPDMGDMQVYAPCYPVACCPVNSVVVIPDFIRSMAMSDEKGKLYLTAYGPCHIRYKGMEIRQETMYPFRNRVTLHVIGNGTVFCKIPLWSQGADVTVNGKAISVTAKKNGYFPVTLTAESSEVILDFHAQIEVLSIDDRDAGNKRPLAFRYGALLFSMPIQEKWDPFYPSTETPLTEEWPWYNVTGVYEHLPITDVHEQTMQERFCKPWNVAVDEKLKPEDIRIELVDREGYVWETPQIVLKVPAYRAPYCTALYPMRTFDFYGDKQLVTEKMELTLVPYGCTNLRITYFARADLDESKKS